MSEWESLLRFCSGLNNLASRACMLVGTWQRLWWGLEAGRELLAHSRVTNSTCFAFENLIETIDFLQKIAYVLTCLLFLSSMTSEFYPLSPAENPFYTRDP